MFSKIALAASLAILSSTAMAAEATEYFYAGGDLGTTKIDGFSNELSYGAFAGYQFNDTFALEASARSLADFDTTISGQRVNLKGRQIGLSVIGTIPFGNKMGVYGRLGYSHVSIKGTNLGTHFSSKDSESRAYYGIGLKMDFTPVISGRVEVQKAASDTTNLSAGVAYRF